MIKELGYCNGIENYSRHLSGRRPGEPPPTLIDYFPKDFLLVVDESHVTLPQVRGMYHGDRSRKQVLVEYGFRLPSALDNRPLTYEEFEQRLEPDRPRQRHAGPGGARARRAARSSSRSSGRRASSTRVIEVRPVKGQVDDLLGGRPRAAAEERARPRHDADQADGRGADVVLLGSRRALPLPPLRHRDARPGRRSWRTSAAASSTA